MNLDLKAYLVLALFVYGVLFCIGVGHSLALDVEVLDRLKSPKPSIDIPPPKDPVRKKKHITDKPAASSKIIESIVNLHINPDNDNTLIEVDKNTLGRSREIKIKHKNSVEIRANNSEKVWDPVNNSYSQKWRELIKTTDIKPGKNIITIKLDEWSPGRIDNKAIRVVHKKIITKRGADFFLVRGDDEYKYVIDRPASVMLLVSNGVLASEAQSVVEGLPESADTVTIKYEQKGNWISGSFNITYSD